MAIELAVQSSEWDDKLKERGEKAWEEYKVLEEQEQRDCFEQVREPGELYDEWVKQFETVVCMCLLSWLFWRAQQSLTNASRCCSGGTCGGNPFLVKVLWKLFWLPKSTKGKGGFKNVPLQPREPGQEEQQGKGKARGKGKKVEKVKAKAVASDSCEEDK